MVQTLNFAEIAKILKASFKKKGLSYEDIAKRSGIPLSTLKKNLTAKDCSLNRLNQICMAAELSLEEVLSANKTEEQIGIRFSKEQSDYFRTNSPAFRVYWYLVYERRSLKEVKTKCHLKDSEVKKILFKLDKLQLLELHPGDRIKLPELRPVKWLKEGLFTEKLYKDWSETLLKDSLKEDPTGNNQFILQFFQLRKETMQELREALTAIELEFSRRTIREMRLYPDQLIPVRVALISTEGGFMQG